MRNADICDSFLGIISNHFLKGTWRIVNHFYGKYHLKKKCSSEDVQRSRITEEKNSRSHAFLPTSKEAEIGEKKTNVSCNATPE